MRLAFNACHVCVQGKAAAASQRVSAMANLVPTVAPQPTFRSDSEASIKAAIAEKRKELQQMAAMDGGDERWQYWSLVREIEKLEGQVKTPYNSSHALCSSPQTLLAWLLYLCVVVRAGAVCKVMLGMLSLSAVHLTCLLFLLLALFQSSQCTCLYLHGMQPVW